MTRGPLPRQRPCTRIAQLAHYEGPTTQILDYVWEHIVPALINP